MSRRQRDAMRELAKLDAKPGWMSYAELKRYAALLQRAIYPADIESRIVGEETER